MVFPTFGALSVRFSIDAMKACRKAVNQDDSQPPDVAMEEDARMVEAHNTYRKFFGQGNPAYVGSEMLRVSQSFNTQQGSSVEQKIKADLEEAGLSVLSFETLDEAMENAEEVPTALRQNVPLYYGDQEA